MEGSDEEDCDEAGGNRDVSRTVMVFTAITELLRGATHQSSLPRKCVAVVPQQIRAGVTQLSTSTHISLCLLGVERNTHSLTRRKLFGSQLTGQLVAWPCVLSGV